MKEIDDLIFGLVRACQPVTIAEVTRELRTQSIEWAMFGDLQKDIELSDAVNTLIALGKIRIDIDAATGQVTLDLPHDAPPDPAGEFLQMVGRSMARRQGNPAAE